MLNEQPENTSIVFEPGGHVDLKDIKAIIDLMKKNSLSEFELEKQDFKIKLKRGPNGFAAAPMEDSSGLTYALPATVSSVVALPQSGIPSANPASNGMEIKSPMIGTFYRSPSPESDEYVAVGTEVSADTVVCIIEAMKVMNEIKAEVKGVITQILVDNAKPVEFGQPLFKIRPI
ncbi:MAG: acetyl-CoA carboxylase biotin carboxyl carrier protein [Verrucomicrobiota bacterium]